MREIRGHLSFMPVMDVIQWAENSKKSGTLFLTQGDHRKRIYFQDGRIIYIWSDNESEQLWGALSLNGTFSRAGLDEALGEAQTLGIPLVGYLHMKELVTKDRFEEIMRMVAEEAISDALLWETGRFEFNEDLPPFVVNSPVNLIPSEILMESVRRFDESRSAGDKIDTERIISEISAHINEGSVDLPPIPGIMMELMEEINNDSSSIEQISAKITDQLLVSKLLRICNSPYFSSSTPVACLRDAVVRIGLRSLMSIITVHALSGFSPRNSEEIKKVLQHSLVCGMIARQLAHDLHSDFEQAFMCGLLHDIGKTVMFDLIGDYLLPIDMRNRLIEDYHAELGYLLAKKWNFGEDIQQVIRYHHAPERATDHKNVIEVVYLSNAMANSSSGNYCDVTDYANRLDLGKESMTKIVERIESLDQDAWACVT